MPNWCTNDLTVRGPDAKTIVDSITKDEGFFNAIIPMPDELRNTESPNTVNSDDMIEKYGSATGMTGLRITGEPNGIARYH